MIDKRMDGIIAATRQLQDAKRQARALGMFTEDRDLLECPACGLWEDVLCDGLLVVYHKDDLSQGDTGLRFREVGEHHFVCPACGATVISAG